MRNIICWGITRNGMVETDFNITPLQFSKRAYDSALKSNDVEGRYFHIIGQHAELYRRPSERWRFITIASNYWKKCLRRWKKNVKRIVYSELEKPASKCS